MLTLQRMMNLPERESKKKVKTLQVMGTITHGRNDWLIDSGASKHMTIFKESFVKLSEHGSPHKVKLGDDHQYPTKGSGESSYMLDSSNSMNM